MATATAHPPPPSQFSQDPPQHAPQHAPQSRSAPPPALPTRKSRSYSFRSDKSRGSGNNHRVDLTETSAEKESHRLHSKADPTFAMQEAEPSEVAASGKSSLALLRSIQHKDTYGNPIADPDRSNPTRNRWERPLDTIRSFEAAIDGGYSNRRSILRPDTEGATWGPSRRTSYYGGNAPGGRFSHDSYYTSRAPSTMYANKVDGSLPDLRVGGMAGGMGASQGQREPYYDQQQQGNGLHGPSAQNGRRGWPRMSSEPQYSSAIRQQTPHEYTTPPNHRSYETVTAASASGSSGEPAGYQTDPTSSDNSSVERVQAVPRRQPEPVNDYGLGFNQSPSYQLPQFTVSVPNAGMNGSGAPSYDTAAPPVPYKEPKPVLRKATTGTYGQQQQTPQPDKRKSWFSRRFNKHG